MRDFRNAKAMAQTIRTALAADGHQITISQSLELIAKAFGMADWNTLSAAIKTEPAAPVPTQPTTHTSHLAPMPNSLEFSDELSSTLKRAVDEAQGRKRAIATLEQLLLSLTDDKDASAVMKACGVDLGRLKADLSTRLDQEPRDEAITSAMPSAGFQRVIQRAVIHVQASGRMSVTGAQLLTALFSEQESQAAQLLGEQGMTRIDAVSFIVHGVVKRGGDAAA